MKQKKIKAPRPTNGFKISSILQSFLKDIEGDKITIGQLHDALGGRSFGLLMLIFALPTLIPMPTPGLSTIIGVPLVLISFQFMIGLENPWFPKWLEAKRLSRTQLEKILKRIIPYIEKMELLTHPRLHVLVSNGAERAIAALCLVLSLIIVMPIPFGNAMPAFVVCLLSIAILQKDGLLVMVSLVFTSVSFGLIYKFMDFVSGLSF